MVRFTVPMPSVYDRFTLVSAFEIRGDQERAIADLVAGLNRGDGAQVLLGVTGSGKTFTMAQAVARVNRPTLVMAHNKTLAAQLYQEFRRFFPENAVEYFVSYYAYYGMMLPLERGQRIDRDQILRKLVEIQYERNDHEFARGVFRVRGDIVEVQPSYEDTALRIELFGDEVDELITFDPLTGRTIRRHDKVAVYPKTHFVTSRDRTKAAVESIKAELGECRTRLESDGKVLEAQRLHQRTMLDLEMIKEIGYCHGIENYAG